ncbi:NAD(P)-dependent dehydrogenase (short-subunit alcohol dehydrogenase family) [Streptomyces sp. V4I8]
MTVTSAAFTGKAAFVTGAGSGIGRTTAVEPLRDRWRLYALTPAASWGWC